MLQQLELLQYLFSAQGHVQSLKTARLYHTQPSTASHAASYSPRKTSCWSTGCRSTPRAHRKSTAVPTARTTAMIRPVSPDTRRHTLASGPSCVSSARRSSLCGVTSPATCWSTRGRGRTSAPTVASASPWGPAWRITAGGTRSTAYHRTCVRAAGRSSLEEAASTGTSYCTPVSSPMPARSAGRSSRDAVTP
ncbi:hypothetical protein V5799_034465 [Amblyomma americanum]|uniref:Uncharacterized protein n=1 Tax=Amblyomma americanum TaxID=6943 RepID=A0AAQ4DKD8_AMBAM